MGAPFEDSANNTQSDNSASNAGAVYVFSGTNWSQQTYLKASSRNADDNFGASLALNQSGNTLAVGAPYDSRSADKAGAAYVFSGTNWSQRTEVQASNRNADDNFGIALALSGDGSTLVVGAIGESSAAVGTGDASGDNSKDGVGAAYLFKRSGGNWSQTNYVKPSTATLGDEFGSAIGLSADASVLAISGAFEQSSATGVGGSQTSTGAIDAGAFWLF